MPEKNEIRPATRRGSFFALEGIDGSGTTTQLGRLTAHLEARGRRALGTREPSDGPIGRLLREILLGRHPGAAGQPVDGLAMALLFAADRRDHLRREIEPALDAGIDVVTDRYLLSSLAYQAEEAAREWVAGLAREVRRPDLTVLIDVPVAVAAGRRRAAGRPVERYDEDGFQARVAENYRQLARAAHQGSRQGSPQGSHDDGSIVVLDGTGSPDDVTRALTAAIDRHLDVLGCAP